MTELLTFLLGIGLGLTVKFTRMERRHTRDWNLATERWQAMQARWDEMWEVDAAGAGAGGGAREAVFSVSAGVVDPEGLERASGGLIERGTRR